MIKESFSTNQEYIPLFFLKTIDYDWFTIFNYW